jgi:hypothetical protein
VWWHAGTTRAQLAAVLRWARAAGWTRETGPRRGWAAPDGSAVVEADTATGELGVHYDPARPAPTWYQAATVAQAVEQLVTLGLLPVELSPCYASGWAEGWHGAQLRQDTVLVQQATRTGELGRLLGRVQVAAWCLAGDDQSGLATVREVLAAAGWGDPAAEMVAAHGEAGLRVGGRS